MFIRHFNECQEITAADSIALRELYNPNVDSVTINHSLAYAVVRPGQSSTPHRLAVSEVYYILSGYGTMHIGAESAEVQADTVIYIPARTQQWIENTGIADLTFLCIVDPAWKSEHEIGS